MPEIKHTFQGGKMNKDLDERLVPNGQYRDAMNIQVRTTDDPDGDGGESGAIQNIKGNKLIGESYIADWHNTGITSNPKLPRCVASVTDEKNDKAYFFFASANHPPNWSTDNPSEKMLYVDTIVEQGLNNQTIPVVVDVYGIVTKISSVFSDLDEVNPGAGDKVWTLKIDDPTSFKPGMRLRFVDDTGTDIIDPNTLKIKAIDQSGDGNWHLLIHSIHTQTIFGGSLEWGSDAVWLIAESDRVLNLSPHRFLVDPQDPTTNDVYRNYITGVNIIDGMIFWTDNYSEPKKINIARCKAGTNINGINNDFTRSTKLYIKDTVSGGYVDANTTDFELDHNGSMLTNGSGIDSYLKEEHITVIKQAPRSAPSLIMKSGIRPNTSPFLEGYTFVGLGESENTVEVGTSYSITNDIFYNTNFKKDDILSFVCDLGIDTDSDSEVDQWTTTQIRAKFISYQIEQDVDTQGNTEMVDSLSTTSTIKIVIITGASVTLEHQDWQIKLELKQKPLFETKFGRFGYRYKYTDGEYSTFSPWSELAFLPDEFSYKSDEGYNLGMVNTLRQLTIKDFIPYRKPLDIIAVDILYKSTDSPNVFVVDTIEKGKSSEWNKFTPDGTPYVNEIKTGSLEITSEMIHRALPSDQILRTWDNVPRYAKAQEIVGNRLLYGNYTQGYNMDSVNVNLSQNVISEHVENLSPAKSIKSIRDYKIGLVFGDKYGRETPVITSGYTVSDFTEEGYTSITGDISVPKTLSAYKNSFEVTQSWGDPNNEMVPPTTRDGGWIDYVKYYIKETSNEYHNLVMDRWYHSGDKRDGGGYDNIWISFNSADRNKVDDDTYLILKNANGSDAPVYGNARYKVLAIENEAPEFIKTKFNSIGVIGGLNVSNTFTTVFPNLTDDTDENQPTQLWTRSSMEIVGNTWNASGMGDTTHLTNVFGRRIKGKLEVRIVGACVTAGTITGRLQTSWKELVHYAVGETDDENEVVKLRWKSPWTESEADMYTRVSELQYAGTPGFTLATLQYWLEIREAVVENKPEFDGKFFVKIKQDSFTNQNIEFYAVPMGGTISYNQVHSSTCRYVRSSYQSNANIYLDNTSANHYGEGNFYEFDWSGDPGPHTHYAQDQYAPGGAAASEFYVEPEGYFFGAFNEWLTNLDDGVYPADISYFFDTAGETVLGPLDTEAADPTTQLDSANDCDCVVEVAANPLYQMPGMDLSPFGSCSENYSIMTRQFWAAMIDDGVYDDTNETELFLDECQMAYMSIVPGPHRLLLGRSTGTGPGDLPPFGGPQNTVLGWENGNYARPREAFSTGEGEVLGNIGAIGGTWGNMVISYTSSSPIDNTTNKVWQALEQAGTIFRFNNLEEAGLFKVMGIMYRSPKNGSHNTAQKNFSGWWPVGNNSMHPDNGSGANDCSWFGSQGAASSHGRYRHTMYVEFRKLDENGQVTKYGLDPAYDPRSYCRHDGVENCQTIEILEEQFVSTSVDSTDVPQVDVDTIVSSNGAVFETEPKKDSDLDIYYEASNALPMVLNERNIFDFAPINSKVTGLVTIGGNENSIQTSNERTNIRVNNAHFPSDFNEHAIISLLSDDTTWIVEDDGQGNATLVESPLFGESFLHRRDFTIGDKLQFEHSDGTITQAVIKQMYKPAAKTNFNSNTDPFVDITADDVRYGVVGGPKAFEHAGDVTKILQLQHAASSNGTGTSSYSSTLSFNISGTHIVGIGSGSTASLEKGMVIKTISFTTSSGTQEVVSFNSQSPTAVAPRGVQILGFNLVSSVNNIYKVVLSNEGPFYNWSDIFSNISGANNSTQTDISVIFQKNWGYYGVDINVWKQPVRLGWSNCYSFGNGLESDRIRDDFNAPMIDNGVKASTTFSGYKRETIGSGLIYSGLYNSKSQVNNLNQFNMGEKITKDLNPVYGSIQALKTRDTDVVVFAEDKILKVLANKDALFNADGNPQLTATDRVLGTAVPYVGDFGISRDPQSLAWDQYRMYFTDRQRGAVLRLSQDGLTPISEIGMSTWFRDHLKRSKYSIGSFDAVSGEYNLTIHSPYHISTVPMTLSFDETAKGWVSFKSFNPSCGVSYSGQYVTVKDNKIWKHHQPGSVVGRNTFYGNAPFDSWVEVIFNEQPSVVKSFKTINYEGSQARIQLFTGEPRNALTGAVNETLVVNESNPDGIMKPTSAVTSSINVTDNEHYNLKSENGWWVPFMSTDLQEGEVVEFKNKEGKWFGKINGNITSDLNIDTSEFTVQGIGINNSYELTSEAPPECPSGCLNDSFECVDCPDPSLNDECTDINDNIISCSSPLCVSGPCLSGTVAVWGCTNENAANYNPEATLDDGSCVYSIGGCTETDNPNYNPWATISQPNDCAQGVVTGCMDPGAYNYDPTATQDGIYYSEFNQFQDQVISMFTPCSNHCSCIYSMDAVITETGETECIEGESTWDPILGICVMDNWFEVCADEFGNIVACTSDNCNSGPCTGGTSGGVSGCEQGGPDCCTQGQAWSEFNQSCEDIVYGCMDSMAVNYMGPIMYHQWPGNTMGGFPNTNGVTYNGLHPTTGLPHPAYATANTACFELEEDSSGNVSIVTNTCCEYPVNTAILGCMDPNACNFDETATYDDGNQCDESCWGCTIYGMDNYDPDATMPCWGQSNSWPYIPIPNACCIAECTVDCYGCTDETADNYNPNAVYDNGTCIWIPDDFDPNTTDDDGNICDCMNETPSPTNPYPCYGCMDDGFQDNSPYPGQAAANYNPCYMYEWISPNEIDWYTPQGEPVSPCIYIQDQVEIEGCMDQTALNFDDTATVACGNCCIPPIWGCMDEDAINFNNGLQEWTGDPYIDVNTACLDCCEPTVIGCMSTLSSNYNPQANVSCTDCCIPWVFGCMNPNATNYNSSANSETLMVWGGLDVWDGTAQGVANGWVEYPCSECVCEFPEDAYDLDVVVSDSSDSSVQTATNTWLLDPETTILQEEIYESGLAGPGLPPGYGETGVTDG